MSSYVRYHLVDRLIGENDSRRHIKTFDSFQELKEFIVRNRFELYKVLPEPEKNVPDYSKVRGFKELVQEMDKYNYMGWQLTAIQTVNKGSTVRRLKSNKRWNYTKKMVKGNRRRGLRYKSGVSEKYLNSLSRKEQEIFIDSNLFRVLHSKRSAILVEWVGSVGTFKGWIPSYLLS